MAIPHFRHPFRLSGSRFATLEQDTPEDVAQCAFCVLGTTPGQREDFPDMGIDDPTFATLDLDDVREQVEAYEPRADVLGESTLTDLIQRVEVRSAVR